MCSRRAGAVLGRNRVPGTGSGKRFQVSMGSDTTGSGAPKVPGSRDCVPQVWKVAVFLKVSEVPGFDGFRGLEGLEFLVLMCFDGLRRFRKFR